VNYREFKGLDKLQITSTKTQTRTKQQVPKHKHAEGQSRFGVSLHECSVRVPSTPDPGLILASAVWSLAFWHLVLVCYLVLVVWCFSMRACFGFDERQCARQSDGAIQ
jgi:hypothetical protein